ncbi:MAG TPA: type II secretion system F family protein [Thermohalobaculum sp.]|nr:type II secretion system F family protein [Thermohalobaculum sp.]
MESGFLLGFIERAWVGLIETYGPAAPFYLIAGMGVTFALLALPVALKKQRDPLDRFSFEDERLQGDLASLREDHDDGTLKGLSQYLEPTDAEEVGETRKMLRRAGYKGGSAVRVYFFTRALLGLGLLLFGMFIFLLVPEEPQAFFGMVMSGLFGLAGFLGPVWWIKRRIAQRTEDIQNAFPDAMDMMLVCIEGGQSLDQAMARVGKEMEHSSGPLAEELTIVSQEFRAGKERATVLRDFADRCGVNDISSFVTVLIQSQAFGTSVSQALRVYADEMRDKRLMRAEEKANLLPTKLTLGTMFFTVPPLILILIGPSFIMIIRALSGLTTGAMPG